VLDKLGDEAARPEEGVGLRDGGQRLEQRQAVLRGGASAPETTLGRVCQTPSRCGALLPVVRYYLLPTRQHLRKKNIRIFHNSNRSILVK